MQINSASQTAWLRSVILAAICLVAFASRLFSVIRFESVIHEFDPWFNFRATKQLVDNGFYEFWNWFDETAWYPLGRVVGGTVYPGIMITSAIIHWILNTLHFTVDIREVCVFLAPLFSGFTAVATYLLTSEVKDSSAGLIAAAFVAIAPGYISRSVAGSYDNEGIAIFLLMITFYCWLKAVKGGSAIWSSATALFYFWMVSAWGGYVFIINLIPLHAFALLLMGRYTNNLYVSYSTFYILGTLSSMQIPFVNFMPTRTSEHMAALGVFGLLQIVAFAELVRSHVESKQFQVLLKAGVFLLFAIGMVGLVYATLTGLIAPWTGRFYSLWDTSYAAKYIPIIASVSEHQPTPWTSWFFDLQWLIFLFPAGIYFCFQELKDEHVFVILYAIAASYFSGVMVRLMLTLTPVVCVGAAVSLSKFLDTYLKSAPQLDADSSASDPKSSDVVGARKQSSVSKDDISALKKKAAGVQKGYIWAADTKMSAVFPMLFLMTMFVFHCTWVTSAAYSSPSVVLASRNADGSQYIIDDFREAYYWLRQNTKPDAKIMSWWDYGYQIAGMADRPTLVDNNTWNNTHIATVGKAMSSPEEVSYDIMTKHDVDYVLVIFGGMLGYSGDDINKFLWMVRIAQGIWPTEVIEQNFFTARGEYRVDDQATPTMRNSLMYKMSYYRFGDMYGHQKVGNDRVRGAQVRTDSINFDTLEEAYSTEHLIVRVYKVKPLDNIGRCLIPSAVNNKNVKTMKKKQ
ncbi:hypothetical protein MP228_004932 [Amoeboaphelidium protococcarum]|nr:hypothetical protein MP228_004932 [Amoeboaphelidium protococcarum]